jgi:PAS domain S-box-containing protein
MKPQIPDEYFRYLVQNSFDVIAILDTEATFVYASPSMERVLGFPPVTLVGRCAFDLIHPDDFPVVQAAFASVVDQTNLHNPTEFRARRMDGAWVYLEALGNNLLAHPEIEGIVLNLREISERKRAEAHHRCLHADLTQAYDATLEGWSRALELRDNETEGHAHRVAELTVRLGRAVGIPNADLGNLRRGALLHDIGKMGVPDSILLKEGPLTDDEWLIMHQHPYYAYEMLLHIPYLKGTLDIPYYHHERWDGTGYLNRLVGRQIPLAARVFAVVDVWDALRSKRPYRPAWTDEKALEYICEQSGAHFDPEVVEKFLQIIRMDLDDH